MLHFYSKRMKKYNSMCLQVVLRSWKVKISSLRVAMQIHSAQCVACFCRRRLTTYFFHPLTPCSETILEFSSLNLQRDAAFICLKVNLAQSPTVFSLLVLCAALMMTDVCWLLVCQACRSFGFDWENIGSVMRKCSEAKFIHKKSLNWPVVPILFACFDVIT